MFIYLFKLLSRPRQAEINLMQESEFGVGGRRKHTNNLEKNVPIERKRREWETKKKS